MGSIVCDENGRGPGRVYATDTVMSQVKNTKPPAPWSAVCEAPCSSLTHMLPACVVSVKAWLQRIFMAFAGGAQLHSADADAGKSKSGAHDAA